MCLGVPGKIIEIYDTDDVKMGKIDFGGVIRETCLDFLPDIEVGAYVVVHVGFAITELSEEDAMETLALLREISNFEEELGVESEGQEQLDAS